MRKPAAVRKGKKLPAPVRILLPAVLWLGLWWILSAAVDREVLIPSPPAVLDRLIHLLATSEFYASVGMSVLRVTAGFAAGILLGSALGLFCAQFRIADAAVSPVMSVIRSTPVASVIILALVWIRKDFIPGLISALMVMPVLFGNVREGYFAADPSLLEMADLFRLKRSKIWSKIRLPAMLPFFAAGVKTSIGLAWKAGVAAEVLSL
ncbi:MAG: ABC transporter permease subunit, partial [Clostridia bacterium]|nr:ABC transporter permease subunit [Clostridia bacterium]